MAEWAVKTSADPEHPAKSYLDAPDPSGDVQTQNLFSLITTGFSCKTKNPNIKSKDSSKSGPKLEF